MKEVDDLIWGSLYVMKALFDHGQGGDLLAQYGGTVIDTEYFDDCFDIMMNAIPCIFADTRQYYDEEKEQEVWAFFDPVFQEFYSLCGRYERERRISAEDDPFRRDLNHALEYSLRFSSFDYNFKIYTDPTKPHGCRIVLMLGCDFGSLYEVAPSLLDICEAYHIQIKKLKEELGILPKEESIVSSSETSETNDQKEAA